MVIFAQSNTSIQDLGVQSINVLSQPLAADQHEVAKLSGSGLHVCIQV